MFGFDTSDIFHIRRNGGGEYNVRVHVGYVMPHKSIISTTILVGVMNWKNSVLFDRFQILVFRQLMGCGRNAKFFDKGAHAGGFHCESVGVWR